MTDEEREKQREQFAAIPTDRTFCIIKLYLDDSNDITGMVQYDGKVLKALGVDNLKGKECRLASRLAHEGVQEAVLRAGSVASVASGLAGLADILRQEGSDDSENSSEGCGQPDCPIHGTSARVQRNH